MGQKQTRRFCKQCGQNRLAVGTKPNHVLHLILTILTAGLWAIVWVVVAGLSAGNFRCSQCGSQV